MSQRSYPVMMLITEHGLFGLFSNGGPADGFNGNMACNFPLRGMKRTLFEGIISPRLLQMIPCAHSRCAGGVRGVGLISGAGLANKGVTLDGLVHAGSCIRTSSSSLQV